MADRTVGARRRAEGGTTRRPTSTSIVDRGRDTTAVRRAPAAPSSVDPPVAVDGTPSHIAPRVTSWNDGAAQRRLHHRLVAGDAIALLVGFAIPLVFWFSQHGPTGERWLLGGMSHALALTAVGLWAVRFQGLWTTKVNNVRAVELTRVARALGIVSIVALVLDRQTATTVRVYSVVAACLVGGVVFVAWRSVNRAALAAEHKRGRYVSRVVVVGTDRRAVELHRLYQVHPELGMRIVAVIGDRREAVRAEMGGLWAGDVLDAAETVSRIDAEVVVLCTADLDPTLINELTVQESARDRTVYVDPGLSRVDLRRLQPTAVGYQPMLQLSATRLNRMQLFLKRAFDLVVATVATIAFALPMALIALAIRKEDGGHVLYRQRRVGLHGEEFEVLKFRSMHLDADQRLAELMQHNERNGPLFKMDDDVDPRITRVGRIIRKLSFDELPQLINVFNGTMSIVGPRPALPSEVEQFPTELLARHDVRPGITGLWQAEARDNAHFAAYHRLDLFYVENWSLALDVVLIVATAEHMVLRPLLRKLFGDRDADGADDDGSPAGAGPTAASA